MLLIFQKYIQNHGRLSSKEQEIEVTVPKGLFGNSWVFCPCMIKQQPLWEKFEWNLASMKEKQVGQGKWTWDVVVSYAVLLCYTIVILSKSV